ncbi:MAG: (2Fe-2S)-binding protein, partial [Desulfobacterales bacterium]|nr:(2Fe-2S)-binding protein [Desulfobacterales bacterium]
MEEKRITKHPILEIPVRKKIAFTWNGKGLKGFEGEMISSALSANNIHVFGHHHKDGSPQGLFCANGQCSQCIVTVYGTPVKACMTPVREGMVIESVEGLPRLPEDDTVPVLREPPIREVEVLILGGGPAGMAAAAELGKLGADTLLIDDKSRLGGKLLLQTHKFFGSVEDSRAGTRGMQIARLMQDGLGSYDSVEVWLNEPRWGCFPIPSW